VTVIIATYNWSSVLRSAVASALRQTFADFELLVVGDGCTDDSEQVVAAFGDRRVRWINLPSNTRHQSGPNNEGLRQARGEIIAYLGHDDLWLPHHLEVSVGALDGTKADVTYALTLLVAPDGSCWPHVPHPAGGLFSAPLSTVHRRRVVDEIGGWRDYRVVKRPPDAELWQRMYTAGYAFTFVPRLTGIKFPAAWRRDVYQSRPSHEQAAWLARLEAEPNFETEQLAKTMVSGAALRGLNYRQLMAQVRGETWRRVAWRFTRPRLGVSWLRGGSIDALRRFKGLGKEN
jgi:glycosyltransferase involved in cell wall biosynthesis